MLTNFRGVCFVFVFSEILDLFSYLVAVALAAVAGYHLADEACKEELEAEDYGYEGEVEERLLCHWSEVESAALLDQLLCNYPDGHETSDQEHQQACEAEEMHRLLSECAEEPEGDKVKEAVYKTLQTEFADSVLSLLVLYRLFRDLVEACVLGQVRDVSVHLSVDLYVLYDFIPVGLEAAVHVVELDACDLAGCPVVQFRREILGKFVVESLLFPS